LHGTALIFLHKHARLTDPRRMMDKASSIIGVHDEPTGGNEAVWLQKSL
jgi:hypothetical protein